MVIFYLPKKKKKYEYDIIFYKYLNLSKKKFNLQKTNK